MTLTLYQCLLFESGPSAGESFFFFFFVCVWGFVNLWKDVIVTEDLVNLKEDGVSAEVAIDVKKGRQKKKIH